jgi:hypothetical protein
MSKAVNHLSRVVCLGMSAPQISAQRSRKRSSISACSLNKRSPPSQHPWESAPRADPALFRADLLSQNFGN